MPQMAPISWLMLFITFSMAFIMFNIMNYFSYLPPSPQVSKLNQHKMHSMNWKW